MQVGKQNLWGKTDDLGSYAVNGKLTRSSRTVYEWTVTYLCLTVGQPGAEVVSEDDEPNCKDGRPLFAEVSLRGAGRGTSSPAAHFHQSGEEGQMAGC